MKVAKLMDELRRLGAAELLAKLDATRRELFNVQLNATTAHVKDYSQFKKLRKDIARVLTVVRKKEQESLI